MNTAVIDIGTNTVILLIAKAVRKKIKVIHDEAIVTRLGQGLTENHFLLSEAMKRTLHVLKHFKERCGEHGVKKIHVVATAACRVAANANVFIDKVKEECGLKVNVIAAKKEAEYTFEAAYQDFKDLKKPLIVVDIGGGSTEIMTGPLATKKKGPATVMSLSLGSVRLTEDYIRTDPISDEEYKRLQQVIANHLSDELDEFYPDDFKASDHILIATAGTATTIAALHKKIKTYKADKIHGTSMRLASLEKVLGEIRELSIRQRQKLPGMEPLRADVILAGAMILNEVMRYFHQKQMVVSDRGLRYGVFYKKFVK